MTSHACHLFTLLVFLVSLSFTRAAPIFNIGTESIFPTSPESARALSALTAIANFAEQAYCPMDAVMNQTCGGNCDATPGVTVLLAGGDGGDTPHFFVAYDPTSQSIVVSHQGTDPHDLLSIINDVDFLLVPINTTSFPLADDDVQVHDGFQKTFERTVAEIDLAVASGLLTYGVTQVQVTGHSLGAALAVLDSVHLSQVLGPMVTIHTTVFGLPRSGNPSWAALVDSTLSGPNPPLIHIHNKNDPVPTIPPHDFGFQHPAGELYVEPTTGDVVVCPGEENIHCSLSNNFLELDVTDHYGPYAGVLMGGEYCLGGGGSAATPST